MRKLLLSIRPEYVRQILEGTKRVEYRTRVRKDTSVNQVLIYQSQDVRKIVAEFRIAGVMEGSPQEIWEKTKEMGGIEEKAYYHYFRNNTVAYAYRICDVKLFETPISLDQLGIDKAPMSYQYVEIPES